MEEKRYVQLESLEVYQLARELSRIGWEIYEGFDWQTKKVMGDQFITATDSVAANIAESYGRYHYLDRVKFLYNARGSFLEAIHWMDILTERGKVNAETAQEFKQVAEKMSLKLQNFIASIYRSRNN